MFNWMNRTVYHTIKYFVLYFGSVIAVLVGLGYLIMVFEYVSKTYGKEAVYGMFWLCLIVVGCIIFAYQRAKMAVFDEESQKDRVEKALKRDWD